MLIELCKVAWLEPTVRIESFICGLFVAIVAYHHIRWLYEKLTAAVDFNFYIRIRLAAGVSIDVLAICADSWYARFGRTVVVHNIKACAVEEIKCILWHRRACGAEKSKLTAQGFVYLCKDLFATVYTVDLTLMKCNRKHFLEKRWRYFACVDLLHYLGFQKLIDLWHAWENCRLEVLKACGKTLCGERLNKAHCSTCEERG